MGYFYTGCAIMLAFILTLMFEIQYGCTPFLCS
jgi:hypothetical protein